MTTPTSLTQAELNYAQSLLQGAGGAAAMYDYLDSKGYDYAAFANGVAQGDSLEGLAAIEFMKIQAESQGHPLSPDEINAIKFDMAKGFFNALQAQFDKDGTTEA